MGEGVLFSLSPPSSGSGGSSGNASWASPLLPSAPALAADFAALLARLAPLRSAGARGSGTPLSATLSDAAHLLLLAPLAAAGLAPLPFSSVIALNVTLGGHPCVINWAAPDGGVISVTTPPLAVLCLKGVLAQGDCGLLSLLLSVGADPGASLFAAVAQAGAAAATAVALGEGAVMGSGAASETAAALLLLLPLPLPGAAALPLPASYPPLRPMGNWSAAAAASGIAPLLTLPLTSLLRTAAALGAPALEGIRIVARCTAPGFAPPGACALVNGAPPPLRNVSEGVCGWGSGDGCVPCPAHALCPGGAALLPLPGFWAPTLTSPPSTLLQCAPPDAAARCPGWAGGGTTAASYGCSTAFRGTACAACAPSFYPAQGTCAACPGGSALVAQLLPIATFVGGLAGLGVLLLAVAHCALARRGRVTRLCGPRGSATAVRHLLMWAWAAAQGAAALFSQLLATGRVPAGLLPIVSGLVALQFQSVALAPACYNATPFQSLWVALGVAGGCACACSGALLALAGSRGGGGACARAAEGALRGAGTVLLLGYGALVRAAADVLVCGAPQPMSVLEYARTDGDGTALTAALGAGGGRGGAPLPSMAQLRAAADDPLLAASEDLSGLLSTLIPVSLLASDPFQPCREGPHAAAWWGGVALAGIMVAVVPGAGLWAVTRRSGAAGVAAAAVGAHGGKQQVVPSASAPLPPLAAAAAGPPATSSAARLRGALADAAFRPEAAWFVFFQMGFTVLCIACVAFAQCYGASQVQVQALQGALIGGALVAAAVALRAAPFTPHQKWRTPVTASLYALTAATAGANLALQVAPPEPGTTAAWALSVTPIAVAGLVFLALLVLWFRALLEDDPVAVAAELAEDAVAAAAAGEAGHSKNGGRAVVTTAAQAFVTTAGLRAALSVRAATAPPLQTAPLVRKPPPPPRQQQQRWQQLAPPSPPAPAAASLPPQQRRSLHSSRPHLEGHAATEAGAAMGGVRMEVALPDPIVAALQRRAGGGLFPQASRLLEMVEADEAAQGGAFVAHFGGRKEGRWGKDGAGQVSFR